MLSCGVPIGSPYLSPYAVIHRVPDKFEDDPTESALFRRHEKALAALEHHGRKNHMTAFWT
jgi:hypothetical protein